MYNECGTKPDLQGRYYENTIVIQVRNRNFLTVEKFFFQLFQDKENRF